MSQPSSLDKIFHRLAVKWAVVGFLLTMVLALICVFYSVRNYSEKHIDLLSRSAAIAFRPFIIDGHIREAQLQMKDALSLKEDETVVVLDQNLNAILPVDGNRYKTHCTPSQKYCWPLDMSFIEKLYPIYFDADQKELFGYLNLRVRSDFNFKIIGAILIILLTTFAIQAVGLVSALGAASSNIVVKLNDWTTLLRSEGVATDKELSPLSLKNAADGLNIEIEKVKKIAADEARTAAQISILKEIGHDLKTPLSQMQKFFSVFVAKTRKGVPVDEVLVGHITSTIDRMRGITNQTRQLLYDINPDECNCDLKAETNRILSDLTHDSEIMEKKIKIHFDAATEIQPARITANGYYRILENILRNSIHAVDEDGDIWLNVFTQSDKVCLSIKDNGRGIAPELKEKIFNFDFSTKPSKGSGMGLGIVKNLCSAFRAEINFTSQIGRGTEFVVAFPPAVRSPVV